MNEGMQIVSHIPLITHLERLLSVFFEHIKDGCLVGCVHLHHIPLVVDFYTLPVNDLQQLSSILLHSKYDP